MRIAMLTYSVKPRGGVVHALEVSEALVQRGHEVELMALARPDEELYRPTALPVRLVRHVATEPEFDERILGMLAAYTEGLAPLLGGFDVVHSQDCLSANAALELRDRRVIDRVLRTVHHVDDFTSPSLVECQDRSILEPDELLCVSSDWVARLGREFGVRAGLVRNGVDLARFRPARDAAERADDRRRAGLGERLTVLNVGGIEPRKGSVTLLEAFAQLRRELPERDPLLVIAGGVTLFDYRHETRRFARRAQELGVAEHVRTTGGIEPEELERLYRAADVFAFPSVKEGFGLAALEALAAELPVVASNLEAFRGFLDGRCARLVPAGDAATLACELEAVARDGELRGRLRAGGRAVARAWSWDAAAAAHERAYEDFLEATTSAPHQGPGLGEAA
jgi:glycosyltransferase-like protein